MSHKRTLQLRAASAQGDPVAIDQPLQPVQVGDVLPVRLDITWMRRIFHHNGRVITASQVHRLDREGKLRRFELHPQIGSKAWSGLKVARWLTGDSFAIEVRRRA